MMLLLSSTLEHVIAARYLKKTKRECEIDFCKSKDQRKISMCYYLLCITNLNPTFKLFKTSQFIINNSAKFSLMVFWLILTYCKY